MVRSKEYKYCKYANGKEYLYDLMADPSENINLAQTSRYDAKKQELKQVLEEWLIFTDYSGQ